MIVVSPSIALTLSTSENSLFYYTSIILSYISIPICHPVVYLYKYVCVYVNRWSVKVQTLMKRNIIVVSLLPVYSRSRTGWPYIHEFYGKIYMWFSAVTFRFHFPTSPSFLPFTSLSKCPTHTLNVF